MLFHNTQYIDSRSNNARFMHKLYLSLQRGKESTSHQKVERPQWIIQIGFVYVPLKLRAEKVKQHFFLIVQTLCHQHRLLVFRIYLCKLVIVPGGFFAIITVIIIVIIIITISLFLMHAPYTHMMQRITSILSCTLFLSETSI